MDAGTHPALLGRWRKLPRLGKLSVGAGNSPSVLEGHR